MIIRKLILFLVFCFPLSAFAMLDGFCTPAPSLITGFNFDNYKKCKIALNQCPKHGPITDEACEHKVTYTHPECIQLKSISMKLDASPTTVRVQKIGNLLLATHFYPADGQEHFAILTPDACLVNTVIDPRKLDKTLAKQHQTEDWMIVNWGHPRFRIEKDGSETAITLLKITQGCRACALIGWATLGFYFTPDGILKDVKLESFKK